MLLVEIVFLLSESLNDEVKPVLISGYRARARLPVISCG